jgi:hypothetical protein
MFVFRKEIKTTEVSLANQIVLISQCLKHAALFALIFYRMCTSINLVKIVTLKTSISWHT